MLEGHVYVRLSFGSPCIIRRSDQLEDTANKSPQNKVYAVVYSLADPDRTIMKQHDIALRVNITDSKQGSPYLRFVRAKNAVSDVLDRERRWATRHCEYVACAVTRALIVRKGLVPAVQHSRGPKEGLESLHNIPMVRIFHDGEVFRATSDEKVTLGLLRQKAALYNCSEARHDGTLSAMNKKMRGRCSEAHEVRRRASVLLE